MIKKSHLTAVRAATAFAVAVVLSAATAASASAQTLSTNLFGGVNAPNPDSLNVSSALAASNQNSGPFGPGYAGTLSLGASALTTVTETMNANGGGTYAIGETGATAVNSTFTAAKTFAGSSLLGGQYYQLTLTKSANSALNVLASFNVQFTTTSGGNTTTILDTTNGVGLLGVTNVLGLFGTSNTAVLTFLTPANLPATPITAAFSGSLSASAVNSTFTFTGASVAAVPEPGTWAILGVGASALFLVRFRRRAA